MMIGDEKATNAPIVLLAVGDIKMLTGHGKKNRARAMFYRGKNFLGAAALLDQKGGYRDVVLHLFCQGLEIVQKSLLLEKDYDKFKPDLAKKGKLGHDLVRGWDALFAEYGWKNLKKETRAEL